jgi:hypothetical protein
MKLATEPFLFEFSETHPQVLEQYKQSLPSKVERLTDETIEVFQVSPRNIDIIQLIRELENIAAGDKEAGRYHTFIMGALESIFYPGLDKPRKEHEIHEGRKRIDIVFNNGRLGFFADPYTLHQIKCPYIFVRTTPMTRRTLSLTSWLGALANIGENSASSSVGR